MWLSIRAQRRGITAAGSPRVCRGTAKSLCARCSDHGGLNGVALIDGGYAQREREDEGCTRCSTLVKPGATQGAQ